VLQRQHKRRPGDDRSRLPAAGKRFHPDNQQTGDENRFRTLGEAYTVLRDPEKRARYDVAHQQQRQDRWRLVASGAQSENDFEMEQIRPPYRA